MLKIFNEKTKKLSDLESQIVDGSIKTLSKSLNCFFKELQNMFYKSSN